MFDLDTHAKQTKTVFYYLTEKEKKIIGRLLDWRTLICLTSIQKKKQDFFFLKKLEFHLKVPITLKNLVLRHKIFRYIKELHLKSIDCVSMNLINRIIDAVAVSNKVIFSRLLFNQFYCWGFRCALRYSIVDRKTRRRRTTKTKNPNNQAK